jgi:hypothetical protein
MQPRQDWGGYDSVECQLLPEKEILSAAVSVVAGTITRINEDTCKVIGKGLLMWIGLPGAQIT